MSQLEAKERAVTTLPGYMSGEKGWPAPDELEFWKEVFGCEEIIPYLSDQIGKYTERFPTAAMLLGEAYFTLSTGRTRAPADFFQNHQAEILSPSGLSLLLDGPLMGALLRKIGVARSEINKDPLQLLSAHQDGWKSFDAGEKALLWWTTWAFSVNKSVNKREVATSLAPLGLNPPKIL